MVREEEFIAWLNDHIGDKLIAVDEGDAHSYYIKIPKTDRFWYLYRQRFYESGILRQKDFVYAGFYDKENGLIYESDYRVRNICPNHFSKYTVNEIRIKFQDDVNRAIRQKVSDDVEYYRSIGLSKKKQEKLEYYETQCLETEARKAYLCDVSSESITYNANYLIGLGDEDILDILAGKDDFIQSEAKKYLVQHEKEIPYEIEVAALKKRAVQELETSAGAELRRIKRIMESVKLSRAKSVTVTIHRNGENLAFKTAAYDLEQDPGEGYHCYHFAAEDRKRYTDKFGRYTVYTPEEIIDISYHGKSIYSAQPYEPEQSETTGLVIG